MKHVEINIYNENCLDTMSRMPNNCVDAIVTDPPYGLSFMGKAWDYDVPNVEIWRECLRVLKYGGHLLAFASTRTQHRMAVNIEDAGFEIRDMIAWIYGSGFPKNLNIGKSIEQYKGWGTALKPALEPITLARKPLSEKTIAANVLKWGTGGINIDECRVPTSEKITNHSRGSESAKSKGKYGDSSKQETHQTTGQELGRFPANLIHDGSQLVLELFPEQRSGAMKKPYTYKNDGHSLGAASGKTKQIHESNSGSAARFFYCAKTSRSERNAGLDNLEEKQKIFNGQSGKSSTDMKGVEKKFTTSPQKNHHPTVKPIKLMQYLVRLITPPNGVVYDPFMGSGSTALACIREGFGFEGSELEKDYTEISKQRIEYETNKK